MCSYDLVDCIGGIELNGEGVSIREDYSNVLFVFVVIWYSLVLVYVGVRGELFLEGYDGVSCYEVIV